MELKAPYICIYQIIFICIEHNKDNHRGEIIDSFKIFLNSI